MTSEGPGPAVGPAPTPASAPARHILDHHYTGPARDEQVLEIRGHPHMEWAYAYGYSKKYTSAGWASYERQFARWAEGAGYDLDFATLHDLDVDSDLLARHRCAIFVGHDEYWSAGTMVRGETMYVGAADAALKSQAFIGEITPETLDGSARGNGVIVHWSKGRGEVFTAATCEWVAGLARNDAQIVAFTRYRLDRFGTA